MPSLRKHTGFYVGQRYEGRRYGYYLGRRPAPPDPPVEGELLYSLYRAYDTTMSVCKAADLLLIGRIPRGRVVHTRGLYTNRRTGFLPSLAASSVADGRQRHNHLAVHRDRVYI